MSRNGSPWPGTLTILRKIFRIPKPPHPSFGRFKRFLRRSQRRPAHSPPPLVTPEGDRDLTRRTSSVCSRRAARIYGGPSTDTNDLGFGCLYDVNKSLPSLPFLDVATANANMAVSADEYNAYQNYASTSSASPPLSALSGGFFAGPDLKDVASSTLVGLSGMDIQHSLLGSGTLLVDADQTGSTSQAGPSAHPFLSDLPHPNALGLEFVVVPRLSRPRRKYLPLPALSSSPEQPSNPSTHAGELTNGQYDYETIYETSRAANDDEPTNEQYQDTTCRSSASSYRTACESLSPQREHQSEMVPETLGM